ncbi:MAG: hypothetical protein WKH64_07025 [Chloroflexia bacterium]
MAGYSSSTTSIRNRSVPTDGVLPHITYQDVGAAYRLADRSVRVHRALPLDEPDGSVHGAQMYLGDAWIQLANARPGRPSPVQLGGGTQSVMVFVADVRAHLERARPRRPLSRRRS